MDKLEAFASLNGPAFYGLPVNEDEITLKRAAGKIPGDVSVEGSETVKPFYAGEALAWTLVD